MCCLVVQIKELNKVLLPPLLAEDNSNPSDIRRQLDSSWGFIRNPTYGQKQHTPRCFREPRAARTDGRNHHPQTVIRGTSGHMLDFFSMKRIEGRHSIRVTAAAASWGSGRQRGGEGARRLLTGHAVTFAVRKYRLSPGAETKARERFLVIQTQFSAYRLQHIICLATAQRMETLCCLTSPFLLAASTRNVRENPWYSKCPVQVSREEENNFPAIFRMKPGDKAGGDSSTPSFRCP